MFVVIGVCGCSKKKETFDDYEEYVTGYAYKVGYLSDISESDKKKVITDYTTFKSYFERNTNYTVYEVFEFEFSKVIAEDFQLDIVLNTTSVDFSTFDDIKAVEIEVHNISAHDITYNFEVDNNNFEVVDSTGNKL